MFFVYILFSKYIDRESFINLLNDEKSDKYLKNKEPITIERK
jgi:hypothetical protein